MKKVLAIVVVTILLATSIYAQEVGYSNKIEEAVANCIDCYICPDGKTIEDGKVCLYFFWGQGCPHCAEEKPFLEELKLKYPNLEIHEFEVYSNQENAKLWQDTCKKYGIPAVGVPTTFVGDKAFVGFAKSGSNSINPTSNFKLMLAALAVSFLIVLLVVIFTKKIKIKVMR